MMSEQDYVKKKEDIYTIKDVEDYYKYAKYIIDRDIFIKNLIKNLHDRKDEFSTIFHTS